MNILSSSSPFFVKDFIGSVVRESKQKTLSREGNRWHWNTRLVLCFYCQTKTLKGDIPHLQSLTARRSKPQNRERFMHPAQWLLTEETKHGASCPYTLAGCRNDQNSVIFRKLSSKLYLSILKQLPLEIYKVCITNEMRHRVDLILHL